MKVVRGPKIMSELVGLSICYGFKILLLYIRKISTRYIAEDPMMFAILCVQHNL